MLSTLQCIHNNSLDYSYKLKMSLGAVSMVAVATVFLLSTCSATDADQDPQRDTCVGLSSCASCLSKSYCAWCVTKSKCTKQACGNDNVIYPKRIQALMAGPQFCPRIVEPEHKLIFQSGDKQIIVVKITQIYLYMAFTQWRCKITLNGEDKVVNAVLLADEVYCDSAELINDSSSPYIKGNVEVMWEFSKTFDGVMSFEVCRCDLDPDCIACNNRIVVGS